MNETARLVASLEVVLESEESLYLRLRDVLRREERELIALVPAQVAEVVEEKRALAEEARLIEDSRKLLTQSLARALGFGEARMRLGALLEALGGEAGELPSRHARLLALIDSTRRLLVANGEFSDRTLRHVQETLRLLGRAVAEPVGYGPGLPNAEGLGRGRLVRAAV